MLRFEIHSNVASSDKGLHRHPVLDDFVQTLATRGVDVRFVRQVFSEESEINLASGRHARGVTVRGKAVRQLNPETHLRGCAAWMRAVLARPERGLHADVLQLRATNGAALVFGQVLGRKRRVFVSGPDADGWKRLTTALDPKFQQIPPAIASSETLRGDYLGRAGRPAGFQSTLQRLVHLDLLPVDALALVKDVLAARNPEQLKALSEAQIVNAGLQDELVERYERIVDQFCTLLVAESVLGELPLLFELITQGMRYEALRESFEAFTLPEKRAEIRNKRTLVNELRIGLNRGTAAQRELFQRRLLRDLVWVRGAQDPALYAGAHRLESIDTARLEALGPPRQWFLAWLREGGPGPVSPAQEHNPAPDPMRQGLLEVVVGLAQQARPGQEFREAVLPPAVVLAREVLAKAARAGLDLRPFNGVHPNLPPRGVATSLLDKVPVTLGQLVRIQVTLWGALYSLGPLAAMLAKELAVQHRQAERERLERARSAFLHGGFRLLASMNYVLGRADDDVVLRQSALAGGQVLGLSVLQSRDEIRRRDAELAEAEDEVLRAEGYQLLMVRDDARWFPMRSAPDVLSGAYRHLVRERVVQGVRRLVAKKLNYLVERYGATLFAYLHGHLTWNLGLDLSPAQLADLLEQARVFDRARLREFGFQDDGSAGAGANPWLQAALDGNSGEALVPFLGSRSEGEVKAALQAFRAVLAGHGRPAAAGAERPTVAQALAALAVEEHYDLTEPPCRTALAATAEAEALTDVLRGLLAPRAQALAAEWEGNDALELGLSGPLAVLALLRERHELELEGAPLLVRLLPAPGQPPPGGVAGALAAELDARAHSDGALAGALQRLTEHRAAWRRLVQVATLPLLDQTLRETVLRIVEPAEPTPGQLRGLPEGQVLCLGASTHDQGKFGRLVARPDRRDVYATLSELASWLARFGRLREEMLFYREVITDLVEIVAGLNLSTYDAPYLRRYAQTLQELDTALATRPEELTLADLAEVERLSHSIGGLVRSYYDQERTVALRDRWMSRIAMRLRAMHPHVRLTFVDALHERAAGAAPEEEAPGAGAPAAADAAPTRADDHQTFSERVRNVVELRESLDARKAFVLSPNNTQRVLTLAVIDELYRLKGVHTAIFVDVSGCEAFEDALRARVPPHRLFDLNAL